VLQAYDRYKRPLSLEEKNRYLKEQAVVGRMGGADWVPETVDEVHAYFERMRPLMSFNEQTRDFLDFLAGTTADFDVPRREQWDRWVGIRASMSLMPEWAQRLTGTHLPAPLQRWWLAPSDRFKAAVIRWAYPELPCRALAIARATADTEVRSPAPEPLAARAPTAA
jgi:uncharacterized protein (DUF2236 family)